MSGAPRFYPMDGVPTAPIPVRPDLGHEDRRLTREQRQRERDARLTRLAPTVTRAPAKAPPDTWWFHRFDEGMTSETLWRQLGARLDALYPDADLEERTADLARLIETFTATEETV